MSDRPRIKPPKALLAALLIQVPLLAATWPLTLRPLPMAAGGATLALGIVLNLTADGRFRRAQVGVCPFSPAAALVEAGPYRFSRNPMYLGMTLLAAAPALVTGRYWNLLAAAGFAIWVHFMYVIKEERFLEGLFGAAYRDYRRRTPRWIGIGSFR